jgi:hypothetical protein
LAVFPVDGICFIIQNLTGWLSPNMHVFTGGWAAEDFGCAVKSLDL